MPLALREPYLYQNDCIVYFIIVGNWNLAVKAAASVLLMSPDDETAAGNMKFYRSNSQGRGVTDSDYLPRNDVKKYHERREKLKRLQKLAPDIFESDEVGFVFYAIQGHFFVK